MPPPPGDAFGYCMQARSQDFFFGGGGVRSLERKGYFFGGGGKYPRVCKLIKLRKTVFASCNFF